MQSQIKLSTPEQAQWYTNLHPEDNFLYLWARCYLRFCPGSTHAAAVLTATPKWDAAHTIISMQGSACLPSGKSAREFIVTVAAGRLQMSILALGPRKAYYHRWRSNTFTDPEFMHDCPLQASMAFGGTCANQPYPPNPTGLGFAIRGHASSTQGLALPRLENPVMRIRPGDCFLRNWSKWNSLPAPWYPDGNSMASHPLRGQEPLAPATTITLKNCLENQSQFQWRLPDWKPIAALVEDGFGRTAEMQCKHLNLNLDSGIATLYYCAGFAIPGRDYLASLHELKAGVAP